MASETTMAHAALLVTRGQLCWFAEPFYVLLRTGFGSLPNSVPPEES